MSKSLMDSLSINQLKLCEKEQLVEYIIELKKQKEEEPKKTLLEQFIDETCDLTDTETQHNGRWTAPTSFLDIFYEYKMWVICQGQRFNNSKEYKQKIKEELIKWQKESVYGCFMAATKQEGKPNGSLKYPLFNLVVNKED
tara:strand:- start:1851 stop:2273 length:423 start_codon:yes stop_codon:yes gene_type:complete